MKRFDAPQYLQLNKGGTPARLSALKMIAASHNRIRPHSMHIDWRTARHSTFGNWAESYCALSQCGNASRAIWYCHVGPQFRNESDAHDVEGVNMSHTGWYADQDCDSLYVPIVANLTHGRWIPGYRMTDSGERVYFGKVFDDVADAAAHGDNEARIDAERKCEYQTRWREARDLHDEIAEHKKEIARLFALRHHRSLGEQARDDLGDEIMAVRKKQAELANDYSDVEI